MYLINPFLNADWADEDGLIIKIRFYPPNPPNPR